MNFADIVPGQLAFVTNRWGDKARLYASASALHGAEPVRVANLPEGMTCFIIARKCMSLEEDAGTNLAVFVTVDSRVGWIDCRFLTLRPLAALLR